MVRVMVRWGTTPTPCHCNIVQDYGDYMAVSLILDKVQIKGYCGVYTLLSASLVSFNHALACLHCVVDIVALYKFIAGR